MRRLTDSLINSPVDELAACVDIDADAVSDALDQMFRLFPWRACQRKAVAEKALFCVDALIRRRRLEKANVWLSRNYNLCRMGSGEEKCVVVKAAALIEACLDDGSIEIADLWLSRTCRLYASGSDERQRAEMNRTAMYKKWSSKDMGSLTQNADRVTAVGAAAIRESRYSKLPGNGPSVTGGPP
jgi:hypothetical protein